jgi:hypothetical protein
MNVLSEKRHNKDQERGMKKENVLSPLKLLLLAQYCREDGALQAAHWSTASCDGYSTADPTPVGATRTWYFVCKLVLAKIIRFTRKTRRSWLCSVLTMLISTLRRCRAFRGSEGQIKNTSNKMITLHNCLKLTVINGSWRNGLGLKNIDDKGG